MRFCPFCAQENTDEASECAHCGRRLPQVAARPAAPSGNPPSAPPLKSPPLRPPPVRPLPRPRPVPPSPVLPTAAAAPAKPAQASTTAAPVPVAAPERSEPRARTGTVLGVAAPISKEPDAELETRVDRSPLDAQTRLDPQPQRQTSDDPSEDAATGLHLPALPRRGDEEETTTVGDDIPTSVRNPIAVLAATPPLGVKKSATPPWGVPGSPTPPTGVAVPTTAPRQPPLQRTSGARPAVSDEDAPTAVGHPGARPSQAQAPEAPTAVDAGVVVDDPAFAELPPMPLPPGPGILPAVKYLPPLAKAVWARIKAQKALRRKLHGDQRVLDETLHELGRAAWQESSRPAELREELGRADEDDGRRRTAESDVARLDMAMVAERERFAEDERRRIDDVAAKDAALKRLLEDLADRKRAQKAEERALREVQGRLAAVEKRVTQLLARADRVEALPPEKGGGPVAAATVRSEAEGVKREAEGIRPDRDAAEARVRALDGPISELEAQIMQARGALAAAQTELEAARKAHKETIAATEAERAEKEEARVVAEKALRLRLISTGTVLSLHRLDGPQHQERFGPIYERLDELKQIAAAGEQRINLLESEWRGYDRAALQRGGIAIGVAFGVLLISLIVLIVVIAR